VGGGVSESFVLKQNSYVLKGGPEAGFFKKILVQKQPKIMVSCWN